MESVFRRPQKYPRTFAIAESGMIRFCVDPQQFRCSRLSPYKAAEQTVRIASSQQPPEIYGALIWPVGWKRRAEHDIRSKRA